MKIEKDFLEIDIDDVIAWCAENNQLDWLATESAKKIEVQRHTKRIKALNDDGTVKLNKKNKPIWVADKSSPVKIVKQKMPFVQLKYNFCEKFMPDKLPQATKPKEPDMYDKIAAALAAAKK